MGLRTDLRLARVFVEANIRTRVQLDVVLDAHISEALPQREGLLITVFHPLEEGVPLRKEPLSFNGNGISSAISCSPAGG